MAINQVLIIEPQELKFKLGITGLFEEDQTTTMQLTNPSADKILFKIKTTAPKKYCVRPNSGVLKSNEKIEIAITPLPVYVDTHDQNTHKFLVQSVVLPASYDNADIPKIDNVWTECKDKLMSLKLMCVFETFESQPMKDAPPGRFKRPPPVAGEPATAAPAASTSASLANTHHSENGDSDLQKAKSEVFLLRVAESKLRHENLQLKEEVERARLATSRRHSYGPKQEFAPEPAVRAAAAVAMALVGIIIGKFFI